jgi:hypothetical protein
MKKITDRGRKILSNFFRVISVSAASLILQACYGIMPPDEPWAAYGMPPEYLQETAIRGVVVSKKTGNPIFGIKVSIDGTEYKTRTNEDGYFYIWLPIQDVYKIIFEDLDGPYNDGLFQKQTVTLKQDNTNNNLMIIMDLDTDAE